MIIVSFLRQFEVVYRETVQAREPHVLPAPSLFRSEPVQVTLLGSIPECAGTYAEVKALVLDLIETCPDCNTVYDVTPDGVVIACDCPPF